MESARQTSSPASFADRKQWFDEELKRLCYIGICDAGLDDAEVRRWTEKVRAKSDMKAVVREYAAQYGLDMADDPWMP